MVLVAEAHPGQHLFSVFVACVNVLHDNSTVVLVLRSHTLEGGTNHPLMVFSSFAPEPVRVGLTHPRGWGLVRWRLVRQPLGGGYGDRSSTGARVCLAHLQLDAPQAQLA